MGNVAGQPFYYSIQQAMGACDTPDETNGMDSTLSHELFETITDPDTTSGWRSSYYDWSLGQYDEIGDLCQDLSHTIALPFQSFLWPYVVYDIQPEWSNQDAHCYPESDYKFNFTLLRKKTKPGH